MARPPSPTSPSRAVAHILKRCSQRGWTQNELGRRIGVRSGTVSRILNGKFTPGLELAARIKRVLGTPFELWLARDAA
jgi:transcriptional regulator with XRE-family HTH domain